MKCEFCELNILADNINLAEQSAACQYCKQTFIFSTQLTAGRPQFLKVVDTPTDRHIEWRWFHFSFFFSITFTLAVNCFWIFWYLALFFGWVNNPPEEHAGLYLFGLWMVALGLYFLYSDLLTVCNKSQLIVNQHNLVKSHGPLPWFGAKSIARQKIVRLVCKREEIQNDNTDYQIYHLQVIRKNGSPVPLIYHGTFNKADRVILQNGGLPNRTSILWIKQQLEQWLGLTAQRV